MERLKSAIQEVSLINGVLRREYERVRLGLPPSQEIDLTEIKHVLQQNYKILKEVN